MKTLITVAALLLFNATSVMADLILAKQKACMSCHRIDKKIVGPAFQQIAQKYANDSSAEELLVQRLKNGTKGAWGLIPMPPYPQLADSDARTLVRWVLAGANATSDEVVAASATTVEGSRSQTNYDRSSNSTTSSSGSNELTKLVGTVLAMQVAKYKNTAGNKAVLPGTATDHQTQSESSPTYASNGSGHGNSNSAPATTEPGAMHCISFDDTSNSLTAFAVNNCNAKVELHWFDEGNCRTGCATGVRANGKESINHVKGRQNWAACFSPAWPRDPDSGRNWSGSGQFQCRRT